MDEGTGSPRLLPVIRSMRPTDAVAAARLVVRSVGGRDGKTAGTADLDPAAVAAFHHFMSTDPGGCFVADDHDRLVGVAVATVRDARWGLTALFVDPDQSGGGLGQRLLAAALEHAEGATSRILVSSPDPRAWKRYIDIGLEMHPAVATQGIVHRRPAYPSSVQVQRDPASVLEVTRQVDHETGQPDRANDLIYAVQSGGELATVDSGASMGFAVFRRDGTFPEGTSVWMNATDRHAAITVMTAVLHHAQPGFTIPTVTAHQSWLLPLLLEVGLRLTAGGAVFCDRKYNLSPNSLLSGYFF